MRRLLLITTALTLLSFESARAQGDGTALPVIPGYMSTSGCLSPALTPCFIPYGPGGGSGGGGLPVVVTPAQRTLVPLDVNSVTTASMAVTALLAGHRTAGGFIQNPVGATVSLCINEINTASGTTSAANTTCIIAGQSYSLTPAAGAVSVVSSDSSHPFSGYGLQ